MPTIYFIIGTLLLSAAAIALNAKRGEKYDTFIRSSDITFHPGDVYPPVSPSQQN